MKLFDSEWKVMEVLWQDGDTTAKELTLRLADSAGWNKNTTYTVIKKCVEKGAIERREPNFLCHACITKEAAQQEEADYAVVTVYDPFVSAYERIGGAYKLILEHLQANGFREKPKDNVLSCFEYVYEKDGMTCMDVFIHTEGVSRSDAFTDFS